MHAGRESIDRFMAKADVRERHETLVRAPAPLVFALAERFDLQSIGAVRAIFRLRGWLMGSSHGPPERRQPLVPAMTALGWGVLARTPGRELVMGAVTQPWLPDVTFRALPPASFAAHEEPDAVKIAWTIETIALGRALTRLRTQTRAVATDDGARRHFLRYWRWARLGILPIRWLLLPALRRAAEREYRARLAQASAPTTPPPSGYRGTRSATPGGS